MNQPVHNQMTNDEDDLDQYETNKTLLNIVSNVAITILCIIFVTVLTVVACSMYLAK